MNLTLSYCNECLRFYKNFYFFLETFHSTATEKSFLHDLITQVFLQSLQYGIVVLGFLDAFVYAHHQHRPNVKNHGNFGDCAKGRIRFMTAITSCRRPRLSGNLSCSTQPATTFPPTKAQGQISVPDQRSFYNTYKKNRLPRMGRPHRRRYSRR